MGTSGDEEGAAGPDPRELWNANAPDWIALSRAGYDVMRDLVNTPAFLEMLPPVEGLRCLDLGCGEGHNTRRVAERGARVVGLDLAEGFARAAAEVRTPPVPYLTGDAVRLPFPAAAFDAVVAFMSLMDVAHPEGALAEVARVLRPGGFTQFSILHPFTSTPVRRWIRDARGSKEALAIGDYFLEGPMNETWTFSAAPPEIQERHRPFTITYSRLTLSSWLNALARAGLVLEAAAEPRAGEDVAFDHENVADSRIIPFFLILRARKPAA